MNQISEQTDKKLNELSRNIGKAEELIEEGTKDKNEAFEKVFELFEEHGLDGAKARFIANDGYYLYKQERNGSPKLDEDQLYALIFKSYSKKEATKIWNGITVKKVDSTSLEAAIQMGWLDAKIVEQCITPGKKSYARIREEWTKSDKEHAQIFGIEKTD